jgi:hypothetical protein
MILLWYYVVQHKSKPLDSEDLSIQGLKGKTANGNRGYADVLLFKRDCLPYLLDSLPRELGLDPVWFTSVARPKMDSVVAHMGAARDLSWCAGIDRHVCREFIDDLTYDSCIKALVKNNKQASTLFSLQLGITELLVDIKNGVSELNEPAASTPTDFKGDGDSDVDPDNMLGCTITIRTNDSKIEDVNIS